MEEDVHVRWAWITLLTQSSRNGHVYGTVASLARIANLSIDQMQDALTKLSQEDRHSSSPDEDGRRIIALDGNSWFIVNYGRYRNMQDPDEIREKNRLRQQKFRDSNGASDDVTESNAPSQDVTKSNDKHKHKQRQKQIRKDVNTLGQKEAFDRFWSSYPRRVGKKAAFKKFVSALGEVSEEKIAAALARHVAQWCSAGTDPQYIPHPATWLNQGRWDDDPAEQAPPPFQGYTGNPYDMGNQ